MSWNYRIIRRKHKIKNPFKNGPKDVFEYTYNIHEVYYDVNGYAGAMTEEPVGPFGSDVNDLVESYKRMGDALNKPILDWDNIPEPGYNAKNDEPVKTVPDVKLHPYTPTKVEVEELYDGFEKARIKSEREFNKRLKKLKKKS